MKLIVNPTNNLNGEIIAPPSKSFSHRAFIAASLANGVSVIKNPLLIGDVEVTIDILKKLGVKILKAGNQTYIIEKIGKSFKETDEILDCKNSGTSIRIFSALSLLVKGGLSFKGEFLRKRRPILPLLESLKKLGAQYQISEKRLYINRVSDSCNTIKIPGDISSQFITALLMICPLLKCEKQDYITIKILTPIISYPYVEITRYVLESFGIYVLEDLDDKRTGNYYINCQQDFRPQTFDIPGDFSSIANLVAATILTPEDSKVIIHNLDFKKPQGDKKIIEILQNMGANIEIDQNKNQIIVYGNRDKNVLNGLDIDLYDTPDLFPILAIVGAFAKDKTTLYNLPNLKLKESDRMEIVTRELSKMGVNLRQEKDKLTIYQCKKLNGSIINHEKDHRIAMALSIAALYADSPSEMNNIEIIEDSYPNFIDDLKSLGANFKLK